MSALIVAVAASTQQLGAGELAVLVSVLRASVACVDVHTNPSPGGEIRGQLDHRH